MLSCTPSDFFLVIRDAVCCTSQLVPHWDSQAGAGLGRKVGLWWGRAHPGSLELHTINKKSALVLPSHPSHEAE